MGIIKYTVPIGSYYGKELEFAEELADMRVGVCIWRHDLNSRYYVRKNGAGGSPVFEGEFEPLFIVDETKAHWHGWWSPDYRPNSAAKPIKLKKAGWTEGRTQHTHAGYLTHNELLDALWLHYNKQAIIKEIRACRDDNQCARILRCLHGLDYFDYDRYRRQEALRGDDVRPVGAAIADALFDIHGPRHPYRMVAMLYRSLAAILNYEEPPRKHLLEWQAENEKRKK